MQSEIPAIREASRAIVRELDLLDARRRIGGHSFSECHFLTELELLGRATASELGERLVLEKSTISRLVKKLVRRAEIRVMQDPADGRRRLLALTADGRRSLERIHRQANARVDAALTCLAPVDRARVVAGLDRYAKALRYSRIGRDYRIRPIRRGDNPAVAGIIRDVMTEYGAVGCGFSIEDPEVDAMFEAYRPPRAAFYVIEHGGQVLGCGGLGPLVGGSPEICEIRKMYFRPALRGKGLGTQLMNRVLAEARAAGYRQCYLETLGSMDQARRLYERHGFREHDGPLGATGHTGCDRFMTLDL